MNEIFQLVSNAEDYSNYPRLYKMDHDVRFFIKVNKDNFFPYKVGDFCEKYNSYVERIIYFPKKWWQFWKKKKVFGVVFRIK